jgi:tetratricopeptide (TPR) repeat protein
VSLWWQILLDPNSRQLDDRFERAAADAVAAARRWTRQEPRRAEAWFYLAGAYGPLVQWRVLRGERLAAAREGSRIKEALERALALDPTLTDAHFGIGLYHYYADVVPAPLKVLRFLLLLPGGDREKGLREMQQARERGQLLRGEADFQMHLLFLWYERQHRVAVDLLRGLDVRYPTNPVFLQRIATVQHEYLGDAAESVKTWQQLLDRARQRRVERPQQAEATARLGLAARLLDRGEIARAVEQLDLVIAARPSAPHGALAEAHLLRGGAHDRIGRRDRAVASYREAVAHAPAHDPARIKSRARAAIGRQ